MNRLVQPELLDALPPADPRALRSRRDLHRINGWMRHHVLLARTLQRQAASTPQKITDLGAGDGKFFLRLAREMAPHWPNVNATLLDRQKNVAPETLTVLADLGWRAEAVVADAFDWSPPDAVADVCVANLFLHHFADASLAGLLRQISRNTKLFVAVEPRRAALPAFVARQLWLIGCNDVTRHDAVVSVHAGFSGREISALWPEPSNWQLTERRAGWCSHLFIARRRE